MKNKLVSAAVTLLVLSSIVFTNTSCRRVDYSKQVNSLDSINHLMHIADSSLQVVDTNLIKNDANHVMVDMQLVKMAHTDSMSKGAAEILRAFSSVRWQLETFMGRRSVMRIEMHKSMDQLSHLSHDLKNNLIKADSVPMYYAVEMKKASLLVESEKTSMQLLNNQLPLFNLIAPQADSLINLVKNHKDL